MDNEREEDSVIHGHIMPKDEVDRLRAAANVHRERGGFLIGKTAQLSDTEGIVESVTVVIAVVEMANISKTPEWHYTYDGNLAKNILDILKVAYGDQVGCVGTWHTHPCDRGFSEGDIAGAEQDSQEFAQAFLDVVVRSTEQIDTATYFNGETVTTEGPVNPELWDFAHRVMYQTISGRTTT